MLNVFLKMCRQLFLFVCVFICFQAATLNPETKCTILLREDTVDKINDDHKICEAN